MLRDVVWSDDGMYKVGDVYNPERFFSDALNNSSEFDLQLGYFSSATISVLATAFASFISKGGKIRLVINQIVSSKDKESITKGLGESPIDCVDLSDFDLLRETFDEYQEQFFNCLAFMIRNKTIDIRIIKPKLTNGIAHTKSGQFRDGDSVISFIGSANFTLRGLFTNLEEIKIDRSDSLDKMTQKRIQNQKKDFDAIMAREKKDIEYLSPDALIAAIRTYSDVKDIDELLDVELKLKEIKKGKTVSIVKDTNVPCFPFDEPREYQRLAFENWKKNKQKGLFAMATGTGKTITSLNCLLEIYKHSGYYKALILVPTITLVEQWEKECRRFYFNKIIKVSSKNNNWKEEVAKIKIGERLSSTGKENSYIIISTYSSFAKERTFYDLNDFPKGQLLLIADEVHNMGSKLIMKRLSEIKYLRRIGLSATPDRQYDEEGNSAINSFFEVKDSYTFEYSMEEAIRNGVLCRYCYYPHIVRLTDNEMAEYVVLSEKIAKYYSANQNSLIKRDPILTALLLKRKRIIHKAANKKIVFKNILEGHYRIKGNLKYSLVYVPEGEEPESESDIFDTKDVIGVDEFTDSLIDQYTMIVRNIDERITVRKFTSQSSDRGNIIKDFADGRIDVLTSMKCLDEGVDVPRSELAIFCASTGNPRQFIQRRGRILRKHPDKHMAIIHDLVVAPKVQMDTASFYLEKSLLSNELKRVKNFALLSENSIDSVAELDDVMRYYGLSMFN